MNDIIYVFSVFDPNVLIHTKSFFKVSDGWLSNYIIPAIKALIYISAGAWITYASQNKLKNNDTKIISLANANLVSVILTQKRASLKKIEYFIQERSSKNTHQKMHISAGIMKIDQEQISKMLSFRKFISGNYANIIQTLIASEQSYKNCFDLIHEYNEIIKNILNLYSKDSTPEINKLIEGYRIERDCCVDNINNAYNEALLINEKSKKHFALHCKKVFRNEYRALDGNEIVKAADLLEN